MVSLSTAESELYAAVKAARERERCKRPRDCARANPALGCFGDNGPGQPQRNGQGETRRHAEPVDTGGIQVGQVRQEESRYERESADLMTKPLPGPKIEQLMRTSGYKFMRSPPGARMVTRRETGELAARRRAQPEWDVPDDWSHPCEESWSATQGSSSERA